VPAIHCRFDIVGRGGRTSCGFTSVSWDIGKALPSPQTESIATSDGPVQPKISPVREMTVEIVRLGSSIGRVERPISLREGRE
jgi:hypothetical protein